MARIRSLHPGQWTDEDFVSSSFPARLVALALRNMADDQGVFEWKPVQIKMQAMPADTIEVGPLLDELVANRQVQRFEEGGKAYGAIRNFRKWQRPEKPKNVHPLPAALRSYVGLAAPASRAVDVGSAKEAAAVTPTSATEGAADGGKSPTGQEHEQEHSTILGNLNAIPAGGLTGQNVILSSGVSNGPGQINLVPQMIAAAKAKGAASVTLMGVGNRPDLAGMNSQLLDMARTGGATFQSIQAGPDGVHPTNYRGLGMPAAGTAPVTGATGVVASRPNVPAMMDAASRVLDPFGQDNPQYQALVESQLRARISRDEFAQKEADRANRETLLAAASGLSGPTQLAAPPTPGSAAPATPAAPATAPVVATALGLPPDPAPGAQAPGQAQAPSGPPPANGVSPVPQRPTSLDQMLQNPAAKQAWLSATPETQRSILAVLEHNAKGEDPPMTPAAQSLYYQLSGMATNDRESFQKLNLADPQYTSALPHSYWNSLAAEQRRFANADVTAQAREASQARFLTVIKPDLIAAGIKVSGLTPGSDDAKKFDMLVGRGREALDQFQQDNGRRPTDAEMAKIGQSLLLQGTARGTAGWLPWSHDTSVRAFQVDPAQFAPTVPPADRANIIAAHKAMNGGQAPTEGQIADYFMRGRAQAMQPRPRGSAQRPGQQVAQAPQALPRAPVDRGTAAPSGPASQPAPSPETAPAAASPQPAQAAADEPEPSRID